MPEQPDLFPTIPNDPTHGPAASRQASPEYQPLAARMRPRRLSEVAGQEHLLKEGGLLPRLIRANSFGSLIFFGPPGSGKTTLAEVIAAETGGRCLRVNAVLSNTAELRDILAFARNRPEERTILFIDEIHRFNKAQQDLLLPDVESGSVRLIGATTHNPGFYINAPLLSRSHLFRLEPLSEAAMVAILQKALADEERGLGKRRCPADADVLVFLTRWCNGDLRRALNALETLVLSLPEGTRLTSEEAAIFARERQIRYDADEDEHYDTVSAYIKSVRGGDPDAALYWMAKMLAGGEDPRFVARRLVILASEDVGLADSRGLGLAMAAAQAIDYVGMPECQYALAHATVFLATAPKSNSAGEAYFAAKKAIQEDPVQAVPHWLRDASTQTQKAMGHGQGYLYSHSFPEAISGQEYLLEPRQFYHPKPVGAEAAIAERLARAKELKKELQRSVHQAQPSS